MLCYLSSLERNYKTLPDPPVQHVNWEFYAILRGKAGRKFPQSDKIEYRSNFLWLVKPGQTYHWVSKPDSVRRVVFHFSHIPETLRSRFAETDCIGRPLDKKQRQLVSQLAEELMVYYLNPTELLDIVAQKVLCELALLFLQDTDHRHLNPLRRKELTIVRQAEEWYQNNLKKNPTIDHVASECGISSSQLRRYFRIVYGLPPHNIFKRIRLYEAARILNNTDWTIDRVCEETGFSNKVDFHRSFKKEYGKTPLYWRKSD